MKRESLDQDDLSQLEAESKFRRIQGVSGFFISFIAIAWSCFQLYTAGFGTLVALKQRAVHLTFCLILLFLLCPARRKSSSTRPTAVDWTLAFLSLASGVYICIAYDYLALRGGLPVTSDYAFGILSIVILLEGTRRTLGVELPILGLLFLSYAFFGDMIPGSFGHSGYSLKRIVEHMYLGTEGIFGIALGVSASYIFLFILFGAFLGETGMSRLINDTSLALAGTSPGGPAKVSVLASGLMGTINGSAVANVATTGAFTIPLMKRVGYRPHFAGAVEAVASTGGQIMPPVMGAAAFIMAEFLNVPYRKIMVAAILPAFLYYLACLVMVHLEALKTGLKGLSRSELPSLKAAIKDRGHLILPLIGIVYLLLKGVTPTYAAFYGVLIAVGASSLRRGTRLSFRGLLRALETGARGSISVAVATAAVGFIVGTSSLTSLGITLGDNILQLAQNQMLPTLILTMFTCIILGMGMPTTAVYIVAATIAAPALLKLGIHPIAAHLFVFYFGNISNVTPPVALAAFAGAGIAGANPGKVGWAAARLALAGFLIPFMWVYSPALILQGSDAAHIILAAITAVIGVILLGVAVQGYMMSRISRLERILLFAASLSLIKPGLLTDFAGLTILAIVYIRQKKSISRLRG